MYKNSMDANGEGNITMDFSRREKSRPLAHPEDGGDVLTREVFLLEFLHGERGDDVARGAEDGGADPTV